MKIFVDENIPFMTVQELLTLGHDVMDIRGTEHEGIIDKELWKIVQKEKRLLITTDKGFVLNRYEKHHGILIIRLKQPNRMKIHNKVMKGISLFKEENWPRMTVVIQDTFHSMWKRKEKI
jgi:predicted nuclease of predicted toxin-antitoxin system